MLLKLSQRTTARKAPASRIASYPSGTPVKSHVASNDDSNWWMITLSDLTLLLLGLLVAWYLLDKNNLNATNLPAARAETAHDSKSSPNSGPSYVDPGDWQTLIEEMQRFGAEIGLAKEVVIEAAPNEIVISLSDTFSSDSGTADLRLQVVPVLQKVVALVVNRRALSLEVGGHVDNAPVSNSKSLSNWKSSTARASRVARYLIDNGVDSSRISVRGYANQRPRGPNTAIDNRSGNRRVEIRLYRGVDQNPVR